MTADQDPGLPIKLGPCSNGEFVPAPPTALARAAVRRARADADDNARRLGLSRRQFLLSAAGAATTLYALAACSSEQHGAASEAGRTTTSGPGGTFAVPPEATTDTTVATTVLSGPDPIVDVQTHLLEFSAAHPPPAGYFASSYPQASCGEDEWWQCYSLEHWLDALFLQSDTTMVVLSAVPVVADPDPLSIDVMEQARAAVERLCGDDVRASRILLQGHAVPNHGDLAAALDVMSELAASHRLAAWKLYTHAGGPGFYLDDHDPDAPAIGNAFLDRVEALGIPIVAVHKGFSSGSPYASPVDIGPAARAHPNLSFTVYHSGYESGGTEGAYRDDGRGVDRLVKSVRDAGVGPGGNVYAELGSTWRAVMGSPDQAAHVLGKLLVAFGPDNVLWGTDSIWYGSPQDQIQAFRAFEISAEFQDRYGYPALTPDIKAKVLGGNAARVYGVDPARARCEFSRDELSSIRQELAMAGVGSNQTLGPVSAAAVADTFRRDHPWA
jgi:predicted TIM-barrel fold metal-dependent hydrolase